MNWKNFLTQLKIANHFSDAELRASRITARGEPVSSLLYIIFLLCLATFFGAILSLIVTSINLNAITSAHEVAGVMIPGEDPSELGINVTSLGFINVGTLVASLATMVELHLIHLSYDVSSWYDPTLLTYVCNHNLYRYDSVSCICLYCSD